MITTASSARVSMFNNSTIVCLSINDEDMMSSGITHLYESCLSNTLINQLVITYGFIVSLALQ